MKTLGWVEGQIHRLLTPALNGGQKLATRPNRFISGETVAGTDWTGGSVGPRIDVDISEITELL